MRNTPAKFMLTSLVTLVCGGNCGRIIRVWPVGRHVLQFMPESFVRFLVGCQDFTCKAESRDVNLRPVAVATAGKVAIAN